MDDAFDLQRFVAAQDAEGGLQQALEELARGRKLSHWMWFVFPQLAGLGRSPTSRKFAVASLDQARAYLAHPLLGPRLRQSAGALVRPVPRRPDAVLGPLDAVKLRSCMTLFARADPDEPIFQEVLRQCFGGEADPLTLRLLGEPG
ncbi:MAG: DUF1810 domain-containing protein [Candidatus Dormibacteria bacterium]